MALTARKINGLDAVNGLLQGIIKGGGDLRGRQFYVHGKTLIFASPSATVSFDTGGQQKAISLPALLAQIASDTTNAVVAKLGRDGSLTLRAATPGTITLDKDGTANADLGLSTEADQTAKLYAAPGEEAPAFVTIEAVPSGEDTYLVVTDE